MSDEPVSLDERRERKRKVVQYFCANCDYGMFLLFADGTTYCANCETEAENLAVMER